MTSKPPSIRLGTVVASRTLQRGAADVVVRLGQPRRSGKDWLCAYQIRGLADDAVKRVYGVDSMQALQLALEVIRATLLAQDDALAWLDLPDVGFGRTVPVFLGKRRVARLNQAIDREIALWSRAAMRRGKELARIKKKGLIRRTS